MAPKKAAAPAAAGGPAAPTPEEAAAKLQLIADCVSQKNANTSETASYEGLKEEKEKLSYMWALSKKELEDKRSGLRGIDRSRADLVDELAAEISVHKNRIKQLLASQQAGVARERVDNVAALKLAEETHIAAERELKADKRDLAAVIREAEEAHEELVRSLKLDNDRAIMELRLEFERETREITGTYEDRMVRLRDELTKAREDEIRGIEHRKTRHIQQLITAHERAFNDIKLYFNEITHSNLDLIKSLKEEVDELKKKESSDEKVMFAIAQENKKMSEPMRKALEEVRRLRQERETYRKDIEALHETKAYILVAQDQLENVKWEHEILEQRYQRLVAERDALFQKFAAAIHEVKQKAGFKSVLLEHKLAAASEEVERESLALNEILRAANLDPASVGSLEKKLGEVIGEKDAVIEALRAELSAVATRHDSAIAFYEAKMHEQGVRVADLGFTPLMSRDLLGRT